MAELIEETGGAAYVLEQRLVGSVGIGAVVRGVEFEACTFESNVLAEARLLGCTFTECTFVGVDLGRATVTDSTFRECRFVESRLLGVNFGLAHVGGLSSAFAFEGCRLDYASFHGLALSESTWRDCRLVDVDFGECDLRRTDFAGSELSGAAFAGADLRDASLVGATGYALDVREVKVKGLRVDAAGAGGLLAPFGIVVA